MKKDTQKVLEVLNRDAIKFISSPHHSPRMKAKIDLVVIHFTAGGPIESSISWFRNPVSKVSAHYLVERDGRIVQMVLEKDCAWHAGHSSWKGQKGVNRRSIGIEVCNWGELKVTNGKLYCWPNNWTTPYHGKHPFYWEKNGSHWEPFTEEQYKSIKLLIRDIKERYIVEVVGHSDVSPGRKVDPGPAFLWTKVI